MISFFKRRNPNPEPAKIAWIAPPQRRGILKPSSELFTAPAKLLDLAQMFHSKNQFAEAEEISRMSALYLLRMHYLLAAQKFNTTLDTPTLLLKLLKAGILTESQVKHANELKEATAALNLSKRSRQFMQFARYLLEVLPIPEIATAAVKNGKVDYTAPQWKEHIRVEGRCNGRTEDLGTHSSFEQASYFASEYRRTNPKGEVVMRALAKV